MEIKKHKKPEFKRKDWHKHSRLGQGRKKKLKWHAAKGRHSKVRLRERGYAVMPGTGYMNKRSERGKISGLQNIRVENLNELKNVPKGFGIIIGSVGKKNKNAIIAKANEMKITILNQYKLNSGVKN